MRIASAVLIPDFLRQSADRYPDKPAVWHLGQWWTYGQIETQSNQWANFLKESGIQPHDRVAILSENSPDYIAAYFGILKAGCVAVPLNTDTTPKQLAYYLNHSDARAIFCSRKLTRYLAPVARQVQGLTKIVVNADDPGLSVGAGQEVVRIEGIYGQCPSTDPNIRAIDIDLAMIVYTSGSTGQPKGVMLSHLNLVSNTRSVVEYLHLTADDRILVVLPFYYIYGKSLLNTHIAVGGSLVIENRFAFPQVVLDTLHKTEATGFAGVPSTFMILLNESEIRRYRFKSLRYVTQAGGHMPTSIQKEVAAVISPAELYVMYGATEAAPRLAYLEPDVLEDKLGSIGRAVPNVEMRIVDENGIPMPPNEIGEIVARGSNIMAGYWKDPEGTAGVLRNGWYHTGDLGKMDLDGYFYVVGRERDIIKTGGFRVSPREVEEALIEIPGVQEAAVIGVADEVLGEAINVFVVGDQSLAGDCELIRAKLSQRLPRYKLPKHIQWCESLPKNEAGKVLKPKLRTHPT